MQNTCIVCKLHTRKCYEPHESFLAKRCGFLLPSQQPATEAGCWKAEQNNFSSHVQFGTAMTGQIRPCSLCRFVVDVRFWPRGWSISVVGPPLMVFEGVPLTTPFDAFSSKYRDLSPRPELAFKFQNPILFLYCPPFLREIKWKITKGGDEKT